MGPLPVPRPTAAPGHHRAAPRFVPGLPEPRPKQSPAARLKRAVESNVRRTVAQAVNSPEGRARAAEGRMKIVGAVYEIKTGRVRWLPDAPPGRPPRPRGREGP